MPTYNQMEKQLDDLFKLSPPALPDMKVLDVWEANFLGSSFDWLDQKLAEDLWARFAHLKQQSKGSAADASRGNAVDQTQIGEFAKIAGQTYDEKTLNTLFANQKDYPNIRKIRGDGNCYYRAIMYGMLEQMVIAESPKREKLLEDLIWRLSVLVEDINLDWGFNEDINDLITALRLTRDKKLWNTVDELATDMKNPEPPSIDRLLVRTSRALLAHTTLYHPFEVEGMFNPDEEIPGILTMGTEAEGAGVHFCLLPKALGVNSVLHYVETNELARNKTKNDAYGQWNIYASNLDDKFPITIHILLRPGHYDLLYSKEQALKMERPSKKAGAAAAKYDGKDSPEYSAEDKLSRASPQVGQKHLGQSGGEDQRRMKDEMQKFTSSAAAASAAKPSLEEVKAHQTLEVIKMQLNDIILNDDAEWPDQLAFVVQQVSEDFMMNWTPEELTCMREQLSMAVNKNPESEISGCLDLLVQAIDAKRQFKPI
jgi:ubiquitin thioesterase protein OTUB1